MSKEPIYCFGQQPCGFLPRRFLYSKIRTALRLRNETGGRIVFFYHDSDHDPRETQTILIEKKTGDEQRLNFAVENKVQKQFSPLFAKKIEPDWQQRIAQQLPKYLSSAHIENFKAIREDNVAGFCLEMYRALGLLEGIEIIRSSDPLFRQKACPVDDYFVDTCYEGEIVRARRSAEGRLRLHKGGQAWIDLPEQTWQAHQISPARDTRLRWMQSVIHCTHYIAGAGEIAYLNTSEAPDVEFIKRDDISESGNAYLP